MDQLVKERKYSIVTQHLGKGIEDFPFNSADIQTLQLLKAYQDEGFPPVGAGVGVGIIAIAILILIALGVIY